MRKLFRFKYEPCNGTCYVWCDFLPRELRKLADSNRQNLVSLMVKAHDRLCDNPDYSFGVDMDDNTNLFIAHFRTPEKTDLFSKQTFEECVNEVCKTVLSTEIPKISGACNYGDNGAENLGKEILRVCEDVAFKELEQRHCVCKE